jgi:hypothetical protein
MCGLDRRLGGHIDRLPVARRIDLTPHREPLTESPLELLAQRLLGDEEGLLGTASAAHGPPGVAGPRFGPYSLSGGGRRIPPSTGLKESGSEASLEETKAPLTESSRLKSGGHPARNPIIP